MSVLQLRMPFDAVDALELEGRALPASLPCELDTPGAFRLLLAVSVAGALVDTRLADATVSVFLAATGVAGPGGNSDDVAADFGCSAKAVRNYTSRVRQRLAVELEYVTVEGVWATAG